MVTVHAALFLFFVTPIVFAGVGEEWFDLNRRASRLQRSGNLKEAIELFQKAAAVAESISPPDARTAAAWNNLGLAQHDLGHPEDAERCYLRSVKLSEQYATSRELAAALGNLATLYLETSRPGNAEALGRRLEKVLETFEPGIPERIRVLVIRAGVHQAHRRFAEAEECYRAALALAETSPEFSIQASSTLNNLSVIAYNQNRLDRARDLLRRAIALTEAQDGAMSPRLISPYVNEATLEFRAKRYKEAAQKLERVIDLLKDIAPGDSMFVQEVYDRYAIALRMAGRKAEAKEAAEHARGLASLRDRYTVDVWSLRK